MRRAVRPAPQGWSVLPWLGPGLLWMVSAVGSGAVLFTPRVAARYEYTLLWLALLVCLLMWIMIREAARYTVVSGRTLLEGFSALPGPPGWALWVIFLPQLLAAVVGIAGLAALVGSALNVAIGGSHAAYTLGVIGLSTSLVATGGYRGVARVSQIMAGVLVALSIVAASQVFPGPGRVADGIVPALPDDLDFGFVLPWVGTILAGSMGIVWYAYWTAARGFGGATTEPGHARSDAPGATEPAPTADRVARAAGWLTVSGATAALGVGLGALVITAFTILGSELLAPAGVIPSGIDVAQDLARLLEGVWGRFGFWALIVTTVFALGGSVIANQDGWSRSFADITRLLLPDRLGPLDAGSRWLHRDVLRRAYAVVVTGVLPVVVFLTVRDPVAIMSASGVVGAAHTPFIVALILLVNRAHLPAAVRPGLVASTVLAAAGLFYLGFALLRFVA